jgi:hypothetical protein
MAMTLTGYRASPDGRDHHILRPLMAPDRPNASPELAAALDTLDRLAASHIAQARLPTAA